MWKYAWFALSLFSIHFCAAPFCFAWAPASGWSLVSLQGSDSVDSVGFFGVDITNDSLNESFYDSLMASYNAVVPFDFVKGTSDYYPRYFLKSSTVYQKIGPEPVSFYLVCQPSLPVNSNSSTWLRSLFYVTGEPTAFQFSGFLTSQLTYVGVQRVNSDVIEPFSALYPVSLPFEGQPVLYDCVFVNGNTSGYDWNLPFKFEFVNEVNVLTSYPLAKRRKSIDLAVSGETLPTGTICAKVKSVFYDNGFDLKKKARFSFSLFWRDYSTLQSRMYSRSLFESPPQNYVNASTYDLDGGGQYDLYEWSMFTDRFDPADDSTCANKTNVDPEPDSEENEPVKSQLVEVGRETADSYRRLIGVQVGTSSELSTESLSGVDLPSVARSSVSSRETIFNSVKSRVESALQQQGQYQALRELFAPLDSAPPPSFALPVTSVTVAGNGTAFTSDFQTDDLTIDFAGLQGQGVGTFFSVARKIASFSIILATAWGIYKMFLGVFGSPVVESSQGETPEAGSDREPDAASDDDEGDDED